MTPRGSSFVMMPIAAVLGAGLTLGYARYAQTVRASGACPYGCCDVGTGEICGKGMRCWEPGPGEAPCSPACEKYCIEDPLEDVS